MKKQILFVAMLMVAGFGYSAKAQVHVGINIGVQPLWGPVGYDQVNYYYLPDIDAYYDVAHTRYVYFEGGRWINRPNLPPRFANYDIYHGYKAVVNEPSPWMHAERYRTQYASYRGRHDQQIIRDSHDDRYRANPHHPEHNMYHGGHDQPHHDMGHHEEHHDAGHHEEHHDAGHHDEHGR